MLGSAGADASGASFGDGEEVGDGTDSLYRGSAGTAGGVLEPVAGCLGTPGGVNSSDDRRGVLAGTDSTGVLGRVTRGAKNGGSVVLRRGGF